jgi:hypothetical protein
MFVNKPELFEENCRRFIVGRLRELLPTAEVPIRLLVRSHSTRLDSAQPKAKSRQGRTSSRGRAKRRQEYL